MADEPLYYLQSVYKLAAVDGIISGREREYLAAVAERLGLSLDEIENSADEEPWMKIGDPVLQKLLVKDLFFISYADGRVDPKESSFIRGIVEAYGLPPSVVIEIDEFVKQGIAWIDRGEKLFGFRIA